MGRSHLPSALSEVGSDFTERVHCAEGLGRWSGPDVPAEGRGEPHPPWYAFVEDEEHPDILRARFDDYRFQFMLTGEERGVLQTRGRWNHTVDVSRKVEIIKLCNEW